MGASAFASTAASDFGADPSTATGGGFYAGGAGGTGTGGEMPTTGLSEDFGSMSLTEALQLQYAIQREVLLFNTLSNVAKARHDAAMNSVRNIKG